MLLYTVLIVIVLPPSRSYLSEISRRSVLVSLFINFHVITTILIAIMAQLIMRFIDFELSLLNIIGILVLCLVFMPLGGYWIGISFCITRQLQRFQIVRMLPILFIRIMIIGSTLSLPFFLSFTEKGVHFYFYTFLSVAFQLIWCCWAKTSIPTRYLLHCLLSIQCLILTNRYYPTLNFQQLSPLEVYLLGMIWVTFFIITFMCVCWKASRNDDYD